MPTEHPTPTPTETPSRPPREHPTGPPTETPETPRTGSPRREPADGNPPDRIDGRLWALTYRSAEVVASIVGLLADVPDGIPVEHVEHEAEGATSTIRNTIAELAQAGVIYRAPTGILKITPLGRAWALGAIDPKIAPLPRLEHRSQHDGSLRLVWRRPTLAALDAGRQSSTNNPTEEVNP